MSTDRLYHRKALAEQLLKDLLGQKEIFIAGEKSLVAKPSSGTFLNAPRRTGKSTFLKQDLAPLLDYYEIPFIYVDLWVDKKANPASLFYAAIQSKLAEDKNFVDKIAKFVSDLKMPVPTPVGNFSIGFNIGGVTKSLTLSDALEELAERGRQKKFVLIVDEAQQSLASQEGVDAMFALKAARDKMNSDPSNPRLLLICTGSSRSKLGSLLKSKDTPFFGAKLSDFPTLDKDFTNDLTTFFNERIRGLKEFDSEIVWESFQSLWRRPEEIRKVFMSVIENAEPNGDTSEYFKHYTNVHRDACLSVIDQQYAGLTPLQQAVLIVMIRNDDQFEAYSTDSLDDYGKILGETISAPSVQTAIEALIEKEIVWRPRRGGYYIDDPMWFDWFKFRDEQQKPINAENPLPIIPKRT